MYKIHEYFSRKSSEWKIIDFLEECDDDDFQKKIDKYLRSLDTIADNEQGRRKEKAMFLLKRYREPNPNSKNEPPDFKEARKWNDRSHKIYMVSGNTINSGTINGGTFNNGLLKETVSKGSNQKKDESDDIDKFFKSPSERKSSNLFSQKTDNSTKKRRKSSNERGSCEVGNGKDKADSISISDDSDYIPASEDDDNSDHTPSDIEDQCPPPLLLSSQLEKFRESYKKMSVAHKWVLSSGKCVEDTLFKHCERLPVESILHSWVIDLDDHEVESLFTIEEWNEVQRAVKKMPEVDRNFADSMMRFSDVKTTSDLRRVLKTTSYLNEDEPYDRLKHYDSEWAEIVMRKFLTYYEDPNEILQKQHLESWYDINVWSLIVDHGLCDVVGMETVRRESSSVAVATRKNRKRVRTRRRKPERRKMGYRMDGIFRMYIGDVEYGAIEVAKKFDETKLLTDGFKLTKAMHDIFVCLSKEVRFEETKVRQLQVAGMLHMGLKLQVLRMSSPKGYVTVLNREKLLDVPATVERIKDLIRVLVNVWRMKKMIMGCMKTVNTRTKDQTDFLREIMGTDTPPITIVVPWSIDTK